jgi:hypothetical protein
VLHAQHEAVVPDHLLHLAAGVCNKKHTNDNAAVLSTSRHTAQLSAEHQNKITVTGHQGPRGGVEGSRGIALLILNLGARRGWVVSTTPRPLYPRERPGTHCTGGWVGPRAGLDFAKNLALTRIRSSDRPARSQSLYRLSYRAYENAWPKLQNSVSHSFIHSVNQSVSHSVIQ